MESRHAGPLRKGLEQAHCGYIIWKLWMSSNLFCQNAEAITFGSGIAAAFACVTHYAPSVIAIRKGYMGVHQGIEVYKRGRFDLVSGDMLLRRLSLT